MAEYKKFNRPGNGGSRPSYGANRPSNGRPSFGGPKEMFDAQCNSCGKQCQVPFRPNGKKPVYCANCFVKDESRGPNNSSSTYHTDSRGDSRTDSRPQRSFNEAPNREMQELKRQIEAMNGTLQHLVTAVDTFNRASALTLEIQKHFPGEKGTAKKAVTPTKSAPAKTSAKKVSKTAAKPAKAPAKKK